MRSPLLTLLGFAELALDLGGPALDPEQIECASTVNEIPLLDDLMALNTGLHECRYRS